MAIGDKTTHALLLPIPAWGHVRPLLVLVGRMVLERPNIVVTILVAPNVLERALSDLAVQYESNVSLKNASHRIRLAATFSSDEKDIFKLVSEFVGTYPAIYQALLDKKPITCAVTGSIFDPVPPPAVVILDYFALPQLRATRAVSGTSVPIVVWLSSTAASTTKMSGPEEAGGFGDIGAKIEAEVQRSGRSEVEAGIEIFTATKGELVGLVGVPPMYDHEFFIQDIPIAEFVPIAAQGYYTLKECDGLLITTFEKFENKGSLKALKSWMGAWGKDVYGIGPTLPLGYGSGAVSSRGATNVEAFLQNTVEKYGKKSVLFISFGTIFWPLNPGYVEELIDTCIDKKLPFIFCHASPFAQIPAEVAKKVEDSQLGLLTPWAPQQYVLSHPAVGWFLTHCGHGGVTEALANGIPLVGWPFSGDQPIASLQLGANHGVLIELVEVRTGPHALKPIRSRGDHVPAGTRAAVGAEIRGVIDALRGARGQELARNAARLKREFAECWEEGGDGKREFGAFLSKYVDGGWRSQ